MSKERGRWGASCCPTTKQEGWYHSQKTVLSNELKNTSHLFYAKLYHFCLFCEDGRKKTQITKKTATRTSDSPENLEPFWGLAKYKKERHRNADFVG